MDEKDSACALGILLGMFFTVIMCAIIDGCSGSPYKTAVSDGWFRYGNSYYTVQEYGPVTNNPPEKEKE